MKRISKKVKNWLNKKKDKKQIKGKKRKIFISLLLLWSLKINPVKGDPGEFCVSSIFTILILFF
jgi:hypothetical protein